MRKGTDVRKQVNKQKLLEYLGNPTNEWPTRVFMNDHVLGYVKSAQYIYKIFTLEEIHEIEQEALALRRLKYSGGIAKVDKALFRQALAGDTAAIKLCYQRFENWGERKELTGKDGKDLNWTIEVVTPEEEE